MVSIFLIVSLFHGAAGLRMKEVAGPPYPDRGESVRLSCEFDTEDARLYSVKWYKDENEFFRYMPDNRPQTQVFPLLGVVLDESRSGINHVTLRDVAFHSSGSYRCEVSTEAPSFETVFSNHNMTVLSYPQEEPTLSGALDYYSVGDWVSINCSAPPTRPPPHIHFFTNNDKAEEWLIERGQQVAHPDGTTSVSAALRFRAEAQHFPPPDAALVVRCEVEAPPLPRARAERTLRLAADYVNHQLAQHTSAASGMASEWVAVTLYVISTSFL